MSKQSFKVSKSLYLVPIDLATIISPEIGELATDKNDSNKLKKYDGTMWVDTTPFFSLKQMPQVVGEILCFAGTVTPNNYLVCDGSAISRLSFPKLFAAIGTTHGQGDGSTTFNVPDYRGRFLRGVDGAAGRDPDKASRTAMNAGGNTAGGVGSVQTDVFGSHTHTQNAHNHTQNAHNHTQDAHGHAYNYATMDSGTYGGPKRNDNLAAVVNTTAYDRVVAATATNQAAIATNQATTATNQNTGGNETRPLNAYVNYFIRHSEDQNGILTTLEPIDLNSILTPQLGEMAVDILEPTKLKKYDGSAWIEFAGGSGGSGTVVDSERYDADSTANQTVINLPFSVATSEKNAFKLYIDGQILREGISYDYTFTNVVGNSSSQVTLNLPIAVGLNIVATKSGGSSASSVTSDRYEADSTTNQTVINLSFNVVLAESKSLQLYIDGQLLREGITYDYTFTNVVSGESSQITLTGPIVAGLNIVALKVGGYETTVSTNSSSIINYIKNNNAETDLTGWSTYADAATPIPVDGTGGSANIAFTRSLINPLRDFASFLLTKGAVNRQGEGFSYDFNIDLADTTKVLQISFDYQIESGTYADDDVTFWVLDKASGQLIQPAPFRLKKSLTTEKMGMEFQATASLNYRLIAHVSSTSALAYSIKFDNFNVGPQAKLYGSPITDWISYTPSIGASLDTSGGYVAPAGRYRRVGDSIEIFASFRNGTASLSGTNYVTIGLPSGFVVDTSKLMNDIGGYRLSGFGVLNSKTSHVYFNGSSLLLWKEGVDWYQANSITSGSSLSIKVTLPILGLSSSTIMSSDADTRVVAAIVTGNPANTSANGVIKFPNVSNDTHSAYNPSTGEFKAPVSGFYRVTASLYGAFGAGILVTAVNGSGRTPAMGFGTSSGLASGTSTVYVKAGDLISVYYTLACSSLSSWCGLAIERVSGPSQISSSESVNALYTGAPPTGTLGSTSNKITFGTKIKDSHGAYVSGVFTVPSSGVYSISTRIAYETTITAVGQIGVVAIAIDDIDKYQGYETAKITGLQRFHPMLNIHSVPLLAGQTITINSYAQGTSPSYRTDATTNFFSITKTGNY